MFLNDRLEERISKLNKEADTMHETSNWTVQMENREKEIYEKLDYLYEVRLRWDSLFFTAEQHQNAMMNAYTR